MRTLAMQLLETQKENPEDEGITHRFRLKDHFRWLSISDKFSGFRMRKFSGTPGPLAEVGDLAVDGLDL